MPSGPRTYQSRSLFSYCTISPTSSAPWARSRAPTSMSSRANQACSGGGVVPLSAVSRRRPELRQPQHGHGRRGPHYDRGFLHAGRENPPHADACYLGFIRSWRSSPRSVRPPNDARPSGGAEEGRGRTAGFPSSRTKYCGSAGRERLRIGAYLTRSIACPPRAASRAGVPAGTGGSGGPGGP
jgi:hypothetical protein